MNNRGEINQFSIWVVIFIAISVIVFLFYTLFFRDLLFTQKEAPAEKIVEKCVDCHNPSSDMSSHHSYEKIGCVSCHSGNPDETEKIPAHTDMIAIPGNLSTARQSCGSANCHPGISERVENSLMSTMSGVVNIQRYFFGESETLDTHVHVKDLSYSPADSYTRNLCASCHLGREKRELGPVNERTRGGGCNACHLNYTPRAAAQLKDYTEGDAMHFHPSLSLKVSNKHCFGCHSRSGRISTSYEGWHESQLKKIPEDNPAGYRKLMDGRIFVKISEDIHHSYGLDCIDCHSGMEVMGDGKRYYHVEDAVKVQCQDCHFKQAPKTKSFNELDFESQKIVGLRHQLDENMIFVAGKKTGYPLVNVIKEKDGYFMFGKNNGKKYELSAPAEVCTAGDAHEDLSCSACHSSWTPQCIRCHVSYDPEKSSFDLLAREKQKGKWIEKGGHFLADPPTLGVMQGENDLRKIQAFVPGMIIEAETGNYPHDQEKTEHFARLFAPIEAHTTSIEARSCSSCHLDPNTLGYGRGKLAYDQKTGKWSFKSFYPPKKGDGLAEDAWIAFMEDLKENRTTRSNGRPFNPEEQKRILAVGACLHCHEENSDIMQQSLLQFDVLKERAIASDSCLFIP